MRRTVLLVDVSYMAYRAFFSTGQLSFRGEPTGILFGMLRDVDTLINQFGASQCVMAFDCGGAGLRGLLLPTYKGNRPSMDEQQAEAFYTQVAKLRVKIFPALGFRNIFRVKGYEADDILAYCANRLPENQDGVIITSDEDLWQCLRTNVSWYSPGKKKVVTSAAFKEEWGIDPCQWPDVKAFAGCSTDNVPGIDGVGEKTAAKWYRGKLKPDSIAYQKISAGLDVHKRNIPLVRLPYPGLELPELRDDELTQENKIKVQVELGIRHDRKPRAESRTGTVARRGFDL